MKGELGLFHYENPSENERVIVDYMGRKTVARIQTKSEIGFIVKPSWNEMSRLDIHKSQIEYIGIEYQDWIATRNFNGECGKNIAIKRLLPVSVRQWEEILRQNLLIAKTPIEFDIMQTLDCVKKYAILHFDNKESLFKIFDDIRKEVNQDISNETMFKIVEAGLKWHGRK
jgi:hypothetical protein